jgi:hypothetical protein
MCFATQNPKKKKQEEGKKKMGTVEVLEAAWIYMGARSNVRQSSSKYTSPVFEIAA